MVMSCCYETCVSHRTINWPHLDFEWTETDKKIWLTKLLLQCCYFSCGFFARIYEIMWKARGCSFCRNTFIYLREWCGSFLILFLRLAQFVRDRNKGHYVTIKWVCRCELSTWESGDAKSSTSGITIASTTTYRLSGMLESTFQA